MLFQNYCFPGSCEIDFTLCLLTVRLKIILAFTLGCACLQSPAQLPPGVEWQRCIPNANVTAAIPVGSHSATVSYVVKGCNDSTVIGLRQYDGDGNLEWDKIYPASDSTSLLSFSLSPSGSNGYLMAGALLQPHGSYHLLMFTDSVGTILLQKTIFFDSIETPGRSKLIRHTGSGYLFAGEFMSGGNRDLLVMHLSESGEVISQSNYGGSSYEKFGDVIAVSGGYLIAAQTNSNDGNVSGNHGSKDAWLVKTGASGNIQWSRCFGDTLNEEVSAVLPVSGGFLVAAMSQSNSGMVQNHRGTTDYYDYWIFRMDTMGNLLWAKSFGGTRDDYVTGMAPLEDSTFVITGSTYSAGGDISAAKSMEHFDDQWSIKIDVNGNLLWEKSSGGSFDDWSCAVAALGVDELIVAGGSLSSDGDLQQSCFSNTCKVIGGGWIVKLNEQCPAFPSAAFTVSQSGKEVSLLNQSINATVFHWDFGDGTESEETNPTHTFTLHGIYDICLTALDTCSSKTTCTTISTCTEPVFASFTAVNEGGTVLSFLDQSVNAAKWLWDFGDGNTSELSSPVHEYGSNGVFNVTLIVMDSCNRADTVFSSVNTCEGFTAAFEYMSEFNTVSFIDLTLGFPESWLWTFGDGEQSTDQHPVHSFPASGQYQVCLIVFSSVCGADTVCQMLEVSCPEVAAAYSFAASNNEVEFTNNSTGADAWQWHFGDGETSAEQNPVHVYAAEGLYEACLIALSNCSSDTACQTIEISCAEAVAAFTFTQSGDTASFVDLSQEAIQWNWTFGDGITSTEQNPVHFYDDTGSYEVCLTIYDGCSTDTACDTIEVYPVSAHGVLSGELFCTLRPNPADNLTWVEIRLPSHTFISIMIQDLGGRELISTPTQFFSAGSHQVALSLAGFAPGIYLIKVTTSTQRQTLKLVVGQG